MDSPTKQSTDIPTNDQSNNSDPMFNRYDSDLTLWKNIQQSKSETIQSQHIVVDDSFNVQHVYGVSQRDDDKPTDDNNGNERVPESPYWLLLVGLFILCMLLGCR